MNPIDALIAYVNPLAGIKRAQQRKVLAYYEAASPSRLRKSRTAPGTANLSTQNAARNLREQARYLEQNHDLARGVLADLVLKTVGPSGITCEPQPRTADGEIHDEFAEQISELFKDWSKAPEVTFQHDWPSAQRLLARSWFRDGEVFGQMLMGRVPLLDHGTTVPFSLEMIEADLCPIEYGLAPSIVQGIELSAWGRPRAYWMYKTAPGDLVVGASIVPTDMKSIPAERMLHLKLVDRIRQLRGVSVFASVLARFDDLKDFEESERIAAKVAASMSAMIIKGAPEDYPMADPDANEEARELKFRPGMIFDDLMPGERVETIDTKRPNPNLLIYRQGQMRAIGSGTMTSFSSIAKDYNGTYSAQRQELVESYSAYATLAAEFINAIVRPTYEAFIATAVAAGVLKVPAGIVPSTVNDAIYVAPQMPWIDPEKEANASEVLERNVYDSAPAIIRRRGGVPSEVIAQQAAWERRRAKAGLDRPEPAAAAPDAPATAMKGAA